MFNSIGINVFIKFVLVGFIILTSLSGAQNRLWAEQPVQKDGIDKSKAEIKKSDIKKSDLKKTTNKRLTNQQRRLLKDKINSQGLNPQPSPPSERTLPQNQPVLTTTNKTTASSQLLTKKARDNKNNNMKQNGLQTMKGSAAVEFTLRGMTNAKPDKGFAKLCNKIKVYAKVPNAKLTQMKPKHAPKMIVRGSGWRNSTRAHGNVCKTEFKAFPANEEIHFIAALNDPKYKLSKLVLKETFLFNKEQKVYFSIVKK
jgi:hypothetical protein